MFIVVVMAKKKSSSGKSVFNMFNQNGLKVILGLVATGSFAIAFGQEKIQQYVSLSPSSNSACLEQFYREIPPYLLKESLSKHSYALCFNGFNVMYSGISKTPLWVAEALTPQRLSQKFHVKIVFTKKIMLQPNIERHCRTTVVQAMTVDTLYTPLKIYSIFKINSFD